MDVNLLLSSNEREAAYISVVRVLATAFRTEEDARFLTGEDGAEAGRNN
jgi:hypothetical protein